MDKLFKEFIEERRYLHNLSEATLTFYKETYRQFEQLNTFDNLSKETLRKAIIAFRERGTSIGAINAYIRGINVFLNWLHVERNYEKLNLKSLRGEKRIMRPLSDMDLKKIVRFKPKNMSERRLHTILLVLMDTGMRIKEALNIKKDSLDLDNLLISVIGKGSKERVVPFSYELRKALYKYAGLNKFELLFSTTDGRKLRYDNVLRDFYLLKKRLKIEPDGAFHAFRRTFATNYIVVP